MTMTGLSQEIMRKAIDVYDSDDSMNKTLPIGSRKSTPKDQKYFSEYVQNHP